jgi:hypothetical protein
MFVVLSTFETQLQSSCSDRSDLLKIIVTATTCEGLDSEFIGSCESFEVCELENLSDLEILSL